MSDDRYDKFGRRNLFNDEDKARQKEELEQAYKKLNQKLDNKIAALEQKNSVSAKVSKADRRELAKLKTKRDGLPERKRLGMEAIDSASVWQDPNGTVHIRAKMAPPQPRLGYEKANRSGLKPKAGEDIAHGRGAGSGFECDCGNFFSSRDLNRGEQNQGIERYAQELYREKSPQTDLWLSNEIRPHAGTKQLQSNTYTLSATKAGSQQEKKLFSVELRDKVQGQTRVGKCEIHNDPNAILAKRTTPQQRSELSNSFKQQTPSRKAASNAETTNAAQRTPRESGRKQAATSQQTSRTPAPSRTAKVNAARSMGNSTKRK